MVGVTAALAEEFARRYHSDQLDLQDRPYVEFHLAPVATIALAIAEGLGFDAEQIEHTVALAWLHDVGEDCFDDDDTCRDALEGYGLGQYADGVIRLTRRGNTPYQGYIAGLVAVAPIEEVVVKLADNFRNSTTLAKVEPAERRTRMANKYRAARPVLMATIAEYAVTGDGPRVC